MLHSLVRTAAKDEVEKLQAKESDMEDEENVDSRNRGNDLQAQCDEFVGALDEENGKAAGGGAKQNEMGGRKGKGKGNGRKGDVRKGKGRSALAAASAA